MPLIVVITLCSCSKQGMGDFEVLDFSPSQKGLGDNSTHEIVIPPNITKMELSGDYLVGLCQPATTPEQEAGEGSKHPSWYFILNIKTKQLLVELDKEGFQEQTTKRHITNTIVSSD